MCVGDDAFSLEQLISVQLCQVCIFLCSQHVCASASTLVRQVAKSGMCAGDDAFSPGQLISVQICQGEVAAADEHGGAVDGRARVRGSVVLRRDFPFVAR